MNNAAAFIGAPIEFKDKFMVYPPKVKDVAANPNYGQYLKILTLSQEEIEDEFVKQDSDMANIPTPFELMLNNCFHSSQYKKLTEDAFYFYTHEKVMFLYDRKIVLFGELTEAATIEDLRVLTENEFFEFQNFIRVVSGAEVVEPPDPDEDPRVKKIKAKARYRDKLKAKKGLGLNLDTCLASICCMGVGVSPLNIGEMSYVAMNKLIRTYQEKEKYEIDIRSLQAGASSKRVQPKYWIRNLND